FGHETAGGFQKTFEDCGGKIVQKIWPPIGTKDFGPFIPTIKADIDAIFALMVGPMSLQFPKQLRASGFKKPILGGGTNYDEFILPSMGDEVIGDVSAFMYSAALDTPANRAFVTKYRSIYGKVASYYSEANYTTAQWIDETMKKHGGKYPGPLEFIKTMSGIKLDAVRGPVRLDDRLTAIQNIYIKKVEKKKMFGYDKDELWNTVIKTYTDVSQFWTYDKDAFLKQPVYSRDFPPCKYGEWRARDATRAMTRTDAACIYATLTMLWLMFASARSADAQTAADNTAGSINLGARGGIAPGAPVRTPPTQENADSPIEFSFRAGMATDYIYR